MRRHSLVIAAAILTAACSKNPPAGPAPAPASAPPATAARPSTAPPATAPATAPAAAAAAPAAAPSGAVDLSGSWNIALDVGGQVIPVDITLTKGANGYTGEALPQGMQSAPLSALTMQGSNVSMTFSAPDGDAV